MENRLIMLMNITVAVKARNILSNAGIHGYVQKTPQFNNKSSCGYSVLVNNRVEEALKILKANNINVLGVTGGSDV
ncbi:MAG: putative Se/S carrier-like protein [Ruminococcus sp.]